ncbi:Retrovirus-related Pol polyprotein from type-1 retrotransposable element R1 [Portunus trituberculatus]|uniref:Retrovirus-related Pol polyprotein from type-1 retrotransposable element R1 n=1 Tax=Portunus trituberculatus TaxID=210409 RepID=A0A5B7H0S9_PORTR|nr:Retrovirus-related Pol polyprotein from type-1 retrotransposable element R1 [Portunus trituberculatus]
MIKVLRNDVFHALAGLNPRKAYGPDRVLRIVLKNLSIDVYLSFLPTFTLFLKKGDRSKPSNYRPISLISCLPKVFQSILNRKIIKHLSLQNLSDRQYAFRLGRSTSDLLAFRTESLSSSFRDFGETFAVALDISKTFDKIGSKL